MKCNCGKGCVFGGVVSFPVITPNKNIFVYRNYNYINNGYFNVFVSYFCEKCKSLYLRLPSEVY